MLQFIVNCRCFYVEPDGLFSKVVLDAVHPPPLLSSFPSHYMPVLLRLVFLHFLGFFPHCRCLSNSFVPYSVPLCDSTHPSQHPNFSNTQLILLCFLHYPCRGLYTRHVCLSVYLANGCQCSCMYICVCLLVTQSVCPYTHIIMSVSLFTLCSHRYLRYSHHDITDQHRKQMFTQLRSCFKIVGFSDQVI